MLGGLLEGEPKPEGVPDNTGQAVGVERSVPSDPFRKITWDETLRAAIEQREKILSTPDTGMPRTAPP